MRRFVFRLRKVMELRRWRERFSQQRLAEAQQEKEQAHQALETALNDLAQQNEDIRGKINSGFNAGDAIIGHRYEQKLQGVASEKSQTLESCQEEVKQRRDELVEASREKQVLETLRDRRLAEYRLKTGRIEQADLDDVAGQRHYRTAKGKRVDGP